MIKVGQMVVIEDGSQASDYSHMWNPAMAEYIGCVATVLYKHPQANSMRGSVWFPCCTLSVNSRVLPFLFDVRYLSHYNPDEKLDEFLSDF